MEFNQVQKELMEMGTAQNRKIYTRHGADPDNIFGVSFANLGKLQKKIKQDHSLARKLWQSGNYDSCNLATKIADGQHMDEKEVNAWLKKLDNYIHISLLGRLISDHPDSHKLAVKLCKETDEIRCGLGHSIISSILSNNNNPQRLTDKQTTSILNNMEKNIHKRPNWARYAMNWCLIAIGTYAPGFKDKAVETAKNIGEVEVDHGETSCKTPDAASYIEKASSYHQKKQKKKAKS